ncbi:MAG: hypothetical protein KAJ39_07810 [Gammaproteobacteria bacterium]|nr:hypothetical protein [Gammaproteobacteria bacterium]
MEITKLEMDVIKNGFGKNDFGEDGEPIWSNSIIDYCEVVTKEQISGVIGSLVKKGLAVSDGETKDATTWLTDAGKKILSEA